MDLRALASLISECISVYVCSHIQAFVWAFYLVCVGVCYHLMLLVLNHLKTDLL